MLILFVRAVILYGLVFFVIRMSGKRQISDLQPFDLIMTLLIADLASEPAADMSIPLLYGVVPIVALFLVQRLVAYISMKSSKIHTFICGTPLILIKNGLIEQKAMDGARYTLNDLMEQLRSKDIFDISDVSYAILETNGSLSVLLKGDKQQPGYKDMNLPAAQDIPPFVLIMEGKLHPEALRQAGFDENWLKKQLASFGSVDEKDYLYALLSGSTLYVQTRGKNAKQRFLALGKESA